MPRSYQPDPQLYSDLAQDRRISNGAFRLWHVIRTFANRDGEAWPGTRKLGKMINAGHSRIKTWRKELEDHGYLRTRRKGLGGLIHYFLPSGSPDASVHTSDTRTMDALYPNYGRNRSRNLTQEVKGQGRNVSEGQYVRSEGDGSRCPSASKRRREGNGEYQW